MSALNERLRARGLLAAATHAGWKPYTYRLGARALPGWAYPLYHASGEMVEGVRRWKAADSGADPKYSWLPAGAERPRYYMLPGALAAIAEMGGTIHLASGEPDLLALHASGWKNTLCWFGELAVPETLADDLKQLGVKRAVFYPDCDETGLKAAQIVADRLRDSGVELAIRQLPGEPGSGYDLNQLWQAASFSPDAFRDRLAACDVLALAEPGSPAPLPRRALPPAAAGDWYRAWIADVRSALGPPATNQGRIERWRCPLPEHADRNPSFRISADQNPDLPWPMCSCGIQDREDPWGLVAAALGVEPWETFRARKASAARAAGNGGSEHPSENAPQTHQNGVDGPLRVVGGRSAGQRLRAIVSGTSAIDVVPILAPYKPLHRFSGLLHLWEPRKVILVIGASGTGKTAFLETCQDGHRRNNQDFIMWGPEWSPTEYQMRAATGQGGPSVIRQRLDQLYLLEEKLGISEHDGRKLPDHERAKLLEILDKIVAWPGEGHYVDQTPDNIGKLLDTAANTVDRLRAAGRRPVVFYLDYVQKAPRRGGDWAEVEFIIGDVCRFAIDYDMVAVVASQAKKDEGRRLRQGELLDEASAQALSDQQANAVITLNPVYIDGERHERGYIRAVKNSLGVYPAKLLVETALYRHRWTDKELSDVEGDVFVDEPEPAPPPAPEQNEMFLPPWWDRD